jgi:hypothetical protein
MARHPSPLAARRPRLNPTLASAGAALAAWVLVGTGCDIQKPVLPTFTTTLTVPIGQERLEMAQLVQDEDFLGVDLDSCLVFAVEGPADTLELDFALEASFAADSLRSDIGEFTLEVSEDVRCDFRLDELYPEAGQLDGQNLSVPPFAFDLQSEPITLADIQSATLSEGELLVTVTNGLPLAISDALPPARISVTLLNSTTQESITTVVFPESIAPGSQVTATADLAGCSVPGTLAVALTGGSPGSSTPVLIEAASLLQITVQWRDLSASQAVAVIGAQQWSAEFSASLPDSIQVVEAEILSGTLRADLASDLAVPCQAQVTFQDVLDRDLQPLQVVVHLPVGAQTRQQIDFAGCTILSTDRLPLRQLSIGVHMTTPGSDREVVTVRSRDGLHAEVEQTVLHFGTITGIVPQQSLALDPVSEQVDLPDELSGIELTEACLSLQVANGTGMPARLDLTMVGTSAAGETASLDLVADILPAHERGLQETTIMLDQDNSSIVPFLNNLPTSIQLQGQIQVGGEEVLGTVHPTDMAVISWRIEAPLAVIITDAVVSGDPQSLQLDADTRELISEHAQEARVLTAVTNHLPFAVEVRLLVGQDGASLQSDPLLAVGPLLIGSGQIDPVTGLVTAASVSEPSIQLTSEQTAVFSLPDLLTLVEVALPSSNGQTVRVRASDYLMVCGAVSLEVLLTD